MGGSRHLTREASPFFWPILRKEYVWTVKPSPGPHPLRLSIPLLIIVRDMLGYATTAREAERIIKSGKIKVDGRIRLNPKFPVGLMDVVGIEETSEYYRLLPFSRYPLVLVKIPREESSIKIGRVVGKRRVRGGIIQITTHDGRNFLFRPESSLPNTYDSIVFKIPSQEVVEILPMREGNYAMIVAGRSVGSYGVIEGINRLLPRKRSFVRIRAGDGVKVAAGILNTFVIGKDRPLVKLPMGWEDVIRRRA